MKREQHSLHRGFIKAFACSVLIMLCLNPVIILAQQKNAKKPVVKTSSNKQATKAPISNLKKNDERALKDVYRDAFLMGVAVTPAITSGADKTSQDIVIKHFNAITVENVMKAALINPQPGVYNWGP